jgi:hypothetical protein
MLDYLVIFGLYLFESVRFRKNRIWITKFYILCVAQTNLFVKWKFLCAEKRHSCDLFLIDVFNFKGLAIVNSAYFLCRCYFWCLASRKVVRTSPSVATDLGLLCSVCTGDSALHCTQWFLSCMYITICFNIRILCSQFTQRHYVFLCDSNTEM